MSHQDQASVPPLPCACASLRRAARAVTQLYDGELRSTGLNTSQFTLLHALALTGPIGQGELGRLLALDSSTLSRTLKPLEAQGWIRRELGTDRRERHLVVTRIGQSRVEAAMPAWQRAQGRLRAQLGHECWKGLASDLATVATLARTA